MLIAIYIMLSIAFANHLGLCEAIAKRVRKWRIPFSRTVAEIIGCAKCLTFWSTILPAVSKCGAVVGIMVSLLCAYVVRWVMLVLALIEDKYIEIWNRNAKKR